MNRNLFAMLAGLILLTPVVAICAPLPKQGPDAPTDSKDTIARFVSVKASNYQGFPAGGVTVALAPAGTEVRLKVFPMDKDKMDFLKSLKAGDYVSLTYGKSGRDLMLGKIEVYDLKPGEDVPGVFTFSKSGAGTLNNKEVTQVMVTKFNTPFVLTVPTGKNSDGKMGPKENLMKAIEGFKSGDMVEVKLNGGEIQTIRLYEPPQLGQLQKVDKVKVGNSDLFAAEVKIDGAVETLAIAKTDIPLINRARAIKNGDLVYFRSTTDDKSTWLIEIKAAPPGTKLPAHKDKKTTTKPATKPAEE
jgi:hypothetical protein